MEAACKELQGEPKEEPRPEALVSTTTTVGNILSGTQLVLRRGSTVLVMLLILATGILLSHFLTELLK